MAVQIQLRRGSSTEWTSANPILAEGEVGLELDTGKIKYGDGVTNWNSLPYGNVGSVVSVNGATGTVVLDADDIDDTGTTHKFVTSSELSKLAGIEAGADVTDAANVEAAGAVMAQKANVINEAGADVDQRIEGSTDPNLVYVDAGNDRVGFGTATPASKVNMHLNNSDIVNAYHTLSQAGSGDIGVKFLLPGLVAYAIGIDNSQDDALRISNVSADGNIGTDPLITIYDSGIIQLKRYIEPRINSTTNFASGVAPDFSSYDVYHASAQANEVAISLPTNLPAGASMVLRFIMASTQTFSPDGSYLFPENNEAPANFESGYMYELVISRGPSDKYLMSWTRTEV